MASSSHMLDKPFRFFKIILSDIDSHTKLMLPRKYVSIYGNKLKVCIYLKAPRGSVWLVDLKKQRDKVWLQNGWAEFAKFYSLCFGHLLVFEYLGDSKFEVFIYDSSACEIDYPLSSGENSDFVKSSQAKKREIIDIDDYSSSDVDRPRKKTRAKLQQRKKNVNGGRGSEEEKDRALALGKAFKSKNPFFIHVMKPFDADGRGPGVYIKKAFEEVYKKWNKNDQVILQVEGRTWPVYYSLYSNKRRFRCGWAAFARDNSLNVGDVCVFKLINPTRKLIEVIIYRAAKGKSCKKNKKMLRVTSDQEAEEARAVRVTSDQEAEEARAVASVKSFESTKPFIRVNINPSNVYGGSVSVPKKFIERYISKESCNVILQVSDGRRWSVKYSVHKYRAKLSAGWMKFVRENGLVAGDACGFELINSSLLNVIIYKN